ncbi:MAG: acyltransferase [Nitrospirae bacterium YQR-1]
MSFLSQEQLEKMNFKKIGSNVLISDKASVYQAEKIEIGDNSRIDDFCVISGKLSIGRNVHVAVFCNLEAGTEGIVLEDFVTLAYGCRVFSESADYKGGTLTNYTVPAKYRVGFKKHVHIARHCIVGTNSVVFPGVTLAEGTSVGAMSLITKSTEPWSIYAGCPARKISERKRDLLELESRYLAEQQ